MKLVIDISENQYEIAKEFIETVDDKSPLANAIANGTPYETVTEFADRCRECGREKVLDEIRTEIEEYKSRQLTWAIPLEDLERGKQIALEYVLKIIDTYRAESEG